MPRLVPITIAALLVWGGSLSADEMAVRGTVPLPISARSLSDKIGLPTSDLSTLLLHLVRVVYGNPDRQGASARRIRGAIQSLPAQPRQDTESVPLPLNSRIWGERILRRAVEPAALVSAILKDRRAAFVYVGLSALDDETLAWVGSNDPVLTQFTTHAEIFSVFGRSLHIRGKRLVVPGGDVAESLWKAVAGADPGDADAFVRRVISGDGRLAFLFDTITHLDPARQRFALSMQLSPASRIERLRSLLESFTAAAPDWHINERPFARPPIDGAILLSTIAVTESGAGQPPISRRIWERIFRADDLNDVPFNVVSDTEISSGTEYLTVDASWLAERILRVPYAIGRRRLDTFLFAQRVFARQPPDTRAAVATALRGFLSFPALSIALERIGITDPSLFVAAAERAAQLSAVQPLSHRRTSIAGFQSALALIERGRRTRVFEPWRAESLVRSLCALDASSPDPYEARLATWLSGQFIHALPSRASAEDTVLAALAGLREVAPPPLAVDWEGHRYRVDPATAELRRLHAIREQQGTPTLDVALAEPARLADVLTSIVYAIYLGDPEGAAVTSGNVALRHDFGLVGVAGAGSSDGWRLPLERFDGKAAWRIRGSLLGLETALARLSLRRLDPTSMPGEPRLGSQDRQTVMLTAALMNPFALTDAARDAVASSIARGRARVAALPEQASRLDDVARDAGLSEWRTHALAWTLTQHPADVVSQFSLLELFWLGSPDAGVAEAMSEWGAAMLPLTGCLCLAMPDRGAWEDFGGRTAAVLGTRGADVPLRVAETLSALKLPAALAPAIAQYATQDVLERSQLAYPDEWDEFSRAARELPRDRMFDYIAALTVNGPLIVEK